MSLYLQMLDLSRVETSKLKLFTQRCVKKEFDGARDDTSNKQDASNNNSRNLAAQPTNESSTISFDSTTQYHPARYVLRLVRDFLTFLVRGGISTVMFCMDQILAATSMLMAMFLGQTGTNLISYPARGALWLYQLLIWVVYVAVEFLLYFPWQLKLLYVVLLVLVYWYLPQPAQRLIGSVRWTLHIVIKILRVFIYGWGTGAPGEEKSDASEGS